jgi:hypothetical protein
MKLLSIPFALCIAFLEGNYYHPYLAVAASTTNTTTTTTTSSSSSSSLVASSVIFHNRRNKKVQERTKTRSRAGLRPLNTTKGAIVIARGTLDANGLSESESSCPAWTHLLEMLSPDQIVVGSEAAEYWGERISCPNSKTEILVTNLEITSAWDQHFVRQVNVVDVSTGTLFLSSPIYSRPITAEIDHNYAAEVAWLSCSVVFESVSDGPDNLHGGHLMVLDTPNVAQRLEGAEFRNFGQQGKVGSSSIPSCYCVSSDDTTVFIPVAIEHNMSNKFEINAWAGAVTVIVLLSHGYVLLLRKLRKLSWLSMISKKPRHSVDNGKFYRLHDVKSGIPSSPPVTAYDGLYMVLNQWPVYYLHLIRVSILLPLRIAQMLLSKLKYGYYGIQSEQDVIDFILHVPSLYMMCNALDTSKVAEYTDSLDDKIWQFELPKDLPGEAYEGSVVLSDMSIIFLQNERRIICATHGGKDVDPNSSSNLLFSIIVAAANNWSHFKSHLMAETSAQEIIDGGIEALEPSARFVHGLHGGLLNSSLSPADTGSPLYAVSVTRQCFDDRIQVPMPHYLDMAKRSLPGFDFLYAARKSIAKHIKAYGLKVSIEPLFQNIAVHSVEHYLGYQFLSQHNFSLDGSETFLSYMRSFLFVEFWMPSKTNPLDDVRLYTVARSPGTHPFYLDVYNDLKRADPVLADQILASTSF